MTTHEITRLALPTTVAKLRALLDAVDAPPEATMYHRAGTLRIERPAVVPAGATLAPPAGVQATDTEPSVS